MNAHERVGDHSRFARKALAARKARLDVADRRDHRADAPVFNRSVMLRDIWVTQAGG